MGANRVKKDDKTGGRSVKTPTKRPAQRLRAARKKTAADATTIQESATQLKIERRRDLVMHFVLSGAENLRAIAASLSASGFDCSHETVRQDIAAVTERLQAKSENKLEQMRAVENGRYEYWTQVFSPLVHPKNAKGEPQKPSIEAGWLLLGISKARREMNNLDKKSPIDVTINAKEALAKLIGCSPDELPDPPGKAK
jgi:hypothetical protein